MTRQTSKGKCSFCNKIFSKGSIAKHLKACKQRKAALEIAAKNTNSKKIKFFHLVVEGRHDPEYWLHLLIPVDSPLWYLDNFLRDIWLECCNHLSAFTIERERYSTSPLADYDEKDMDAALCDVLTPGIKFYHEYDFGTTTDLTLRIVSEFESSSNTDSIQILARNNPPLILCSTCENLAAHCLNGGQWWLCDECMKNPKYDEAFLLPVVNSPRVGMCAYTGPENDNEF